MRSSFMQMASPRPPMPPVTRAMRCAIGTLLLLDFFSRVAARRRLDRLATAAAQLLPRGDELAAVRADEARPLGPPAARQLLRVLEPLFRIRTELVVHPVAALVLGGGIDCARGR